jgi:NAD(P)-dependent dehydrogenase (short-subunit alcohol dehydrogenase family)
MTSASSTVVLITGGNTGVGFETARALLKSSTGTTYTVLLGSRSLERGQSAADALWAEFKGAEVVPIQVDIEDEGSVDEAFAQVSEQFGRVDVLINNAGETSGCDLF